MRIVFSFLASILLFGCSSGISVNVPESYQSSPEQKAGYLVGSLSATTAWPSSGEGLLTTLHFRQTGNQDAITLANDNSRADFTNESLTGQLFALALPAGEYELFSVSFKGSNGNKAVNSQTREDLGLFFTIEAGKVSYIGQFIASSLVAKSKLWNMEYPSGYGYITHNYANQRDKALLEERHPELASLPFKSHKISEVNKNVFMAKP